MLGLLWASAGRARGLVALKETASVSNARTPTTVRYPVQALFAGRVQQACTGLGCYWSPQVTLRSVSAASAGQEVGRALRSP